MAFLFEKLKVYQKSVDFAESVISLTQSFPKGFYFLRDQLNRASTSIAANIAEGNGRFTRPDRRQFFGIARGSLHECLPFLEIAFRKGFVSQEQYDQLKDELEEISRMLSGLVKSTSKRA
ncbi:four helix bundle protein [bacterium]|nr:four helix bundle protein [bacterium]